MDDIKSRNDIETIVGTFYTKALEDDVIKHFFHDVVKVDLSKHLPVITDFWESILLETQVYKDNAMSKHMALHRLSPMGKEHFDRWLSLWDETVTSLYLGPKADLAIERAQQIGMLMQHKISNLRK